MILVGEGCELLNRVAHGSGSQIIDYNLIIDLIRTQRITNNVAFEKHTEEGDSLEYTGHPGMSKKPSTNSGYYITYVKICLCDIYFMCTN